MCIATQRAGYLMVIQSANAFIGGPVFASVGCDATCTTCTSVAVCGSSDMPTACVSPAGGVLLKSYARTMTDADFLGHSASTRAHEESRTVIALTIMLLLFLNV